MSELKLRRETRLGAGTRIAVVGGVTHIIRTLAFLGIALGPLGCYATAGAYADADADYVEADDVPPQIEVYPSYVYGGRTVYLVNDRWYYRRGPHWVYYRQEPVELQRRRVAVRQAPRGPDRRAEEQRAAERQRAEQHNAAERQRAEEHNAAERQRAEQHKVAERRAQQQNAAERRRAEEQNAAERRRAEEPRQVDRRREERSEDHRHD